MTLDQSTELTRVTSRHTRRILLTAYRERGAAALPHGHRGRRPTNATPEALVADVAHLARTRYAGINHTYPAELLAERKASTSAGPLYRQDHSATGLAGRWVEQSPAPSTA